MSTFQSNSDASVSVLAALVGALAEPGRYNIVSRDGELFIQPSRAQRFARRKRWQPRMRPTGAPL
jgi:hypothetical protein